MQITNEIKAKVFAPYVGSECEYKWWNREDEIFKGKIIPKIFESLYNNDGVITYCVAKLKPLNAITDEDAIELTKILFWKYQDAKNGRSIITNLDLCNDLLTGFEMFTICQFLQSRGYDLPNFHLSGKTLFECGLCIYNEK